MDFWRGWKTSVGATGTLLGGLAMIFRALTTEEGVDFELLSGGIAVIGGALAVFGIGKKIEREKSVP